MGEIMSMDWSSSHHSQCEFVAKTARAARSQAKKDLGRLRAEGGGHAVLDFVRLGAELVGQSTCIKE